MVVEHRQTVHQKKLVYFRLLTVYSGFDESYPIKVTFYMYTCHSDTKLNVRIVIRHVS